MGQNQSVTDNLMNMNNLQLNVMKYSKIFSEIGSLSYEEFQKCLEELNELSRKCLDNDGKQLVFVVKKGTDTTMLWKATVRIACVKIDSTTRQIESHKLLNLKQFLCVFRTFQSNLQSLLSSEQNKEQHEGSTINDMTASILMGHVDNLMGNNDSPKRLDNPNSSEELSECCICLDRKTEVLLPCAHTFCYPCIEQWNVSNKTCPICSAQLESTDDTWVMSEIPNAAEISDKICAELKMLNQEL